LSSGRRSLHVLSHRFTRSWDPSLRARGTSPASPGAQPRPGEHRLFRSVPLVVRRSAMTTNAELYQGSSFMMISRLGRFSPVAPPSAQVPAFPGLGSRTLNPLNHHLAVLFVFSFHSPWTVHLVTWPSEARGSTSVGNFLNVFLTAGSWLRSSPANWGSMPKIPDTSLRLRSFGTSEVLSYAILTFLGGLPAQTEPRSGSRYSPTHLAIAALFVIGWPHVIAPTSDRHSIREILEAHNPPQGTPIRVARFGGSS